MEARSLNDTDPCCVIIHCADFRRVSPLTQSQWYLSNIFKQITRGQIYNSDGSPRYWTVLQTIDRKMSQGTLMSRPSKDKVPQTLNSQSPVYFTYSSYRIVICIDISRSIFSITDGQIPLYEMFTILLSILNEISKLNIQSKLVTITAHKSETDTTYYLWSGQLSINTNISDLLQHIKNSITSIDISNRNIKYPNLQTFLNSIYYYLDLGPFDSCPVAILITTAVMSCNIPKIQEQIAKRRFSLYICPLKQQSQSQSQSQSSTPSSGRRVENHPLPSAAVGMIADVSSLRIICEASGGSVLSYETLSDKNIHLNDFTKIFLRKPFYVPLSNLSPHNNNNNNNSSSNNNINSINSNSNLLDEIHVGTYQLEHCTIEHMLSCRLLEGYTFTSIEQKKHHNTTELILKLERKISKLFTILYFISYNIRIQKIKHANDLRSTSSWNKGNIAINIRYRHMESSSPSITSSSTYTHRTSTNTSYNNTNNNPNINNNTSATATTSCPKVVIEEYERLYSIDIDIRMILSLPGMAGYTSHNTLISTSNNSTSNNTLNTPYTQQQYLDKINSSNNTTITTTGNSRVQKDYGSMSNKQQINAMKLLLNSIHILEHLASFENIHERHFYFSSSSTTTTTGTGAGSGVEWIALPMKISSLFETFKYRNIIQNVLLSEMPEFEIHMIHPMKWLFMTTSSAECIEQQQQHPNYNNIYSSNSSSSSSLLTSPYGCHNIGCHNIFIIEFIPVSSIFMTLKLYAISGTSTSLLEHMLRIPDVICRTFNALEVQLIPLERKFELILRSQLQNEKYFKITQNYLKNEYSKNILKLQNKVLLNSFKQEFATLKLKQGFSVAECNDNNYLFCALFMTCPNTTTSTNIDIGVTSRDNNNNESNIGITTTAAASIVTVVDTQHQLQHQSLIQCKLRIHNGNEIRIEYFREPEVNNYSSQLPRVLCKEDKVLTRHMIDFDEKVLFKVYVAMDSLFEYYESMRLYKISEEQQVAEQQQLIQNNVTTVSVSDGVASSSNSNSNPSCGGSVSSGSGSVWIPFSSRSRNDSIQSTKDLSVHHKNIFLPNTTATPITGHCVTAIGSGIGTTSAGSITVSDWNNIKNFANIDHIFLPCFHNYLSYTCNDLNDALLEALQYSLEKIGIYRIQVLQYDVMINTNLIIMDSELLLVEYNRFIESHDTTRSNSNTNITTATATSTTTTTTATNNDNDDSKGGICYIPNAIQDDYDILLRKDSLKNIQNCEFGIHLWHVPLPVGKFAMPVALQLALKDVNRIVEREQVRGRGKGSGSGRGTEGGRQASRRSYGSESDRRTTTTKTNTTSSATNTTTTTTSKPLIKNDLTMKEGSVRTSSSSVSESCLTDLLAVHSHSHPHLLVAAPSPSHSLPSSPSPSSYTPAITTTTSTSSSTSTGWNAPSSSTSTSSLSICAPSLLISEELPKSVSSSILCDNSLGTASLSYETEIPPRNSSSSSSSNNSNTNVEMKNSSGAGGVTVVLSETVVKSVLLESIRQQIWDRHLLNFSNVLHNTLYEDTIPFSNHHFLPSRSDLELAVEQCQSISYEIDLSTMCRMKSIVLAENLHLRHMVEVESDVDDDVEVEKQLLSNAFECTVGSLIRGIPNNKYYVIIGNKTNGDSSNHNSNSNNNVEKQQSSSSSSSSEVAVEEGGNECVKAFARFVLVKRTAVDNDAISTSTNTTNANATAAAVTSHMNNVVHAVLEPEASMTSLATHILNICEPTPATSTSSSTRSASSGSVCSLSGSLPPSPSPSPSSSFPLSPKHHMTATTSFHGNSGGGVSSSGGSGGTVVVDEHGVDVILRLDCLYIPTTTITTTTSTTSSSGNTSCTVTSPSTTISAPVPTKATKIKKTTGISRQSSVDDNNKNSENKTDKANVTVTTAAFGPNTSIASSSGASIETKFADVNTKSKRTTTASPASSSATTTTTTTTTIPIVPPLPLLKPSFKIFENLKKHMELFVATDTLHSLQRLPIVTEETLALVQNILSEIPHVKKIQASFDFLLPPLPKIKSTSSTSNMIISHEALVLSFVEQELERRIHCNKLGEIFYVREWSIEANNITTTTTTSSSSASNNNAPPPPTSSPASASTTMLTSTSTSTSVTRLPCWLVVLVNPCPACRVENIQEDMTVLTVEVTVSLRLCGGNRDDNDKLQDNISSSILSILKDCCRLGNQYILLKSLYDTRNASAYLIAPTVSSKPETSSKLRTMSVIVPRSGSVAPPPVLHTPGTAPTTTSTTIDMGSNTTTSTDNNNDTSSSSSPAVKEYLRADQFTHGCFNCSKQSKVQCTNPFSSLTQDVVIRELQGAFSPLMPMNITDNNCFISKDSKGDIFYMSFDTSTDVENIKLISISLYGIRAVDEKMLAKLKSDVETMVDELMAKTIASQLARKAFHSSFLPFLKSGKSRQIDINFPLPSYINDIYLFCYILRQVLISSQIFMNDVFNISLEKQNKKSLHTVVHPAIMGYDLSIIPHDKREKHMAMKPISPDKNSPSSSSSLAGHQFERRSLQRREHVKREIVKIRETDQEILSPIFFSVPLVEKLPQQQHPPTVTPATTTSAAMTTSMETTPVLFNQNDFTFLYNFIPQPFQGGGGGGMSATATNTKHKQIGKGLALIEISPFPGIAVTGSKIFLNKDIPQIIKCLQNEDRMSMSVDVSQYQLSNSTHEPTSYRSDIYSSSSSSRKNSNAAATSSANSTSTPIHHMSGIQPPIPTGFDHLLKRDHTYGYIKVRIFPAIPMQTQALLDLINEYFDQALIHYCIDRVYNYMNLYGNSYPPSNSTSTSTSSSLVVPHEVVSFRPVIRTLLSRVKPSTVGSGMYFLPAKMPKKKGMRIQEKILNNILEVYPFLKEYMNVYNKDKEVFLDDDSSSSYGQQGPRRHVDQLLQWCDIHNDDIHDISDIVFGGPSSYNTSSTSTSSTATLPLMMTPTHSTSASTSISSSTPSSTSTTVTDIRQLVDGDILSQLSLSNNNSTPFPFPLWLLKRRFSLEFMITPKGLYFFYTNIASIHIEKMKTICLLHMNSMREEMNKLQNNQLINLRINQELLSSQINKNSLHSFPTAKQRKSNDIIITNNNNTNTTTKINSENFDEKLFSEQIEQLYWRTKGLSKMKMKVTAKDTKETSTCLQSLPAYIWSTGIIIASLYIPIINLNFNFNLDMSSNANKVNDKSNDEPTNILFNSIYIQNLHALMTINCHDTVVLIKGSGNNNTGKHDDQYSSTKDTISTSTSITTSSSTEDAVFFIIPIPFSSVINVTEVTLSSDKKSVSVTHRMIDIIDIIDMICPEEQKALVCQYIENILQNDKYMCCRHFQWSNELQLQHQLPYNIWEHPILKTFRRSFLIQSIAVLFESLLVCIHLLNESCSDVIDMGNQIIDVIRTVTPFLTDTIIYQDHPLIIPPPSINDTNFNLNINLNFMAIPTIKDMFHSLSSGVLSMEHMIILPGINELKDGILCIPFTIALYKTTATTAAAKRQHRQSSFIDNNMISNSVMGLTVLYLSQNANDNTNNDNNNILQMINILIPENDLEFPNLIRIITERYHSKSKSRSKSYENSSTKITDEDENQMKIRMKETCVKLQCTHGEDLLDVMTEETNRILNDILKRMQVQRVWSMIRTPAAITTTTSTTTSIVSSSRSILKSPTKPTLPRDSVSVSTSSVFASRSMSMSESDSTPAVLPTDILMNSLCEVSNMIPLPFLSHLYPFLKLFLVQDNFNMLKMYLSRASLNKNIISDQSEACSRILIVPTSTSTSTSSSTIKYGVVKDHIVCDNIALYISICVDAESSISLLEDKTRKFDSYSTNNNSDSDDNDDSDGNGCRHGDDICSQNLINSVVEVILLAISDANI